MSFISLPTKRGYEAKLYKPIGSYIKGNYDAGKYEYCKKGLETLQRLRDEILQKLNDSNQNVIDSITEYVFPLSSYLLIACF